MANVIVDTGPLVAWLNRDENHHQWAKEQFAKLRPPLLTCEAVLSEAVFLLQRTGYEGGGTITALVSRGVLSVVSIAQDEAEALTALLHRYRNVPISFADACLVRLSELTSNATVFTLDSDFHAYRRHGRRLIRTLMP